MSLWVQQTNGSDFSDRDYQAMIEDYKNNFKDLSKALIRPRGERVSGIDELNTEERVSERRKDDGLFGFSSHTSSWVFTTFLKQDYSLCIFKSCFFGVCKNRCLDFCVYVLCIDAFVFHHFD